MKISIKGIVVGVLLGVVGALLVHWARPQVPATELSFGLLVNLLLLAVVVFTVYYFIPITASALMQKSDFVEHFLNSACCMGGSFIGGLTAGFTGGLLGFVIGALVGLVGSLIFAKPSQNETDMTVTRIMVAVGMVIGMIVGLATGTLPFLSLLIVVVLCALAAYLGGLLFGNGIMAATGGGDSPSFTIGVVAAIVMVAAFLLIKP